MVIGSQALRKPSRTYLRRGHPLTKHLVGSFPFYTGRGSTLRDVSGYGFDGTINGATWTAGPLGHALSFDGTDDWVGVDDNITIELNDPGTGQHSFVFSAWINVPSGVSSINTVAAINQSDGGNRTMFWLNEGDGGEIALWLDGQTNANGSTDLRGRGWTHVGAFADDVSQEVTTYVDGQQDGFSSNVNSFVGTDDVFSIGQEFDSGTTSSDTSNHWEGEIANLQVWRYPATDAIMGQLANQPWVNYITKPR